MVLKSKLPAKQVQADWSAASQLCKGLLYVHWTLQQAESTHLAVRPALRALQLLLQPCQIVIRHKVPELQWMACV